jgi:hypothetical protein
MSHIHWVEWGTGTPKDRDEVNRMFPILDLNGGENTVVELGTGRFRKLKS